MEEQKCNCELYYTDSAIRERCVAYAVNFYISRPQMGGDMGALADEFYRYIKAGEPTGSGDKQ